MSHRAEPPPAGGDTQDTLDTREVAGKGKRSRRKRTTQATTVRRIQAAARERQDAWRESGQPNRTYQLTRQLDGLYDDHRDEQAGTLTDPYFGRTMKAGR